MQGRGCVRTEAETARSKDVCGHQQLGEARTDPPAAPAGRARPCGHLGIDFWPPDCATEERTSSWRFKSRSL